MKRDVFRAMGTSVDVTALNDALISDTHQLFDVVESVCSRFRPTSELSRINASPSGSVPLSPFMARVMHAAQQVRGLTGGLVDAGVGEAVRAWGYDRTFEDVRDRAGAGRPTPIARGEWSVDGSVLHRDQGTRIDLGGIAKGWTCDLSVEEGLASVVSAGGDVRSGARSGRVEIVDPWGNTAATVQIGVGALATSSVARRRWRVGSREANHLIDPRTMAPSDGPILQASAIASTALEADAAAKAILLLGVDGLAWADRQPWIRGALVVWNDGNVYATTDVELAA